MAATLATVTPAVAQQMEIRHAARRSVDGLGRAVSVGDLDGRQRHRGRHQSDVDVPVQDVLKDLAFGAMLAVDVEKGRFGIGFNGLFARVSPDSKWATSRSTSPATAGSSRSRPSTVWSSGSTALVLGCAVAPGCRARGRPFASPTCAPRSTCTPAGPSLARKLGRPADRLAHRAGPHRPLRAHRRGQLRRFRGRLRLHLERPGLCRLPVQPCSAGRPRCWSATVAVSGLSPQQFRVGRDHAGPVIGMPAVNYDLMLQEMLEARRASPTRSSTGRACSTGRTRRSRPTPTRSTSCRSSTRRTRADGARDPAGRRRRRSTATSWTRGRRRWRMSGRPASTRARAANT